MGVENFLNYEHYINLQNRQLEIWGQPCTTFVPENITNLGYENVTRSETDMMSADSILSNKYKRSTGRIWINFKIEKKVFYKFNYFPEDGEDLVMAFMDSSVQIRENAYIRTSVPSTTSIWGDLIFQVVHIQDVGLAQVLQRVYFLKATNNRELYNVLDIGSSGASTGVPTHDTTVIKPTHSSIESYSDLKDKPSINDVILDGNKTTQELKIETEDKYNDTEGSTITIGGITEGDKFDDKPITDVVYQMLHPYTVPEFTVTTVPEEGVYSVDEIINTVDFRIDYKKGSVKLKFAIIKLNGVVATKFKLNDEGVLNYKLIMEHSLTNNDTLEVVMEDEEKSTVQGIGYEFVNNLYIGVIPDSIVIDEESIKSLSKVLQNVPDLTTDKLTCEYGRVVYAYPKSYPEIKCILDCDTGFNVKNSFKSTYINIDTVEYRVYYLEDSSGFDGISLIFKS